MAEEILREQKSFLRSIDCLERAKLQEQDYILQLRELWYYVSVVII